jgi:hypothetical protein
MSIILRLIPIEIPKKYKIEAPPSVHTQDLSLGEVTAGCLVPGEAGALSHTLNFASILQLSFKGTRKLYGNRTLKGQCQEIFIVGFFHESSFPRPLVIPVSVISICFNFFSRNFV